MIKIHAYIILTFIYKGHLLLIYSRVDNSSNLRDASRVDGGTATTLFCAVFAFYFGLLRAEYFHE